MRLGELIKALQGLDLPADALVDVLVAGTIPDSSDSEWWAQITAVDQGGEEVYLRATVNDPQP